MILPASPPFDLERFLAIAGFGRKIVELKRKQTFFTQGDQSNSIFYLQKGRPKITVVSTNGKEATITLLVPHDFSGEEAVSTALRVRAYTATAITTCSALQISRKEAIDVIHRENKFSDLFVNCLLARSVRTQQILSISCSTRMKNNWREHSC